MSQETSKPSSAPMSKLKFSMLYWLCSIIVTVIVTPLFAGYVASGTTAREGTSGYAYVYAVAACLVTLSTLAIIIYLIWLFKRLFREKEQRQALAK
jgi:hypothetical protein